jgi:hypothetical protein
MRDYHVFPRVTQLGQQAPGMELRDWFAGMALQGIISRMNQEDYDGWLNLNDWSCATGDAYRMADFMIETRERTDLHV